MILRQSRGSCHNSPMDVFAKDIPLPEQRAMLLCLLTQTLQRHHVCSDPLRTLTLLEEMVMGLEQTFNTSLDVDVVAGLLLHLACSQGQKHLKQSERIAAYMDQCFLHELYVCKQAISEVNSHLAPLLPEEEAYTLVSILCQVDIFPQGLCDRYVSAKA